MTTTIAITNKCTEMCERTLFLVGIGIFLLFICYFVQKFIYNHYFNYNVFLVNNDNLNQDDLYQDDLYQEEITDLDKFITYH